MLPARSNAGIIADVDCGGDFTAGRPFKDPVLKADQKGLSTCIPLNVELQESIRIIRSEVISFPACYCNQRVEPGRTGKCLRIQQQRGQSVVHRRRVDRQLAALRLQAKPAVPGPAVRHRAEDLVIQQISPPCGCLGGSRISLNRI
ncbi:hypothetical protein D3C73_806850 [compost metagenome]